MIKQIVPIDFQWPTIDPFLFCVHHFDYYPKGNQNLGLDSHHFIGRQMGSDFQAKNGFRLYHGEEIPGFPVHPHRGFETITIVRKGYADHADSLGAAGRYGEGDVQWMTAGRGVQHSEMFPLLYKDKENTLELFQIWINLPKSKKMSDPTYKMLWSENIPKIEKNAVHVNLICGEYENTKYFDAPRDSYAADANNGVQLLLVKISPHSEFKLPKSKFPEATRMVYFFSGAKINIHDHQIESKNAILVDSQTELKIEALEGEAELLILDGKPINEPVVQHGPFVMNTKAEIIRTFEEYQKNQFGGWPWPRHDMIHGPEIKRFAKYPDGTFDYPSTKL